MLRILSGWGKQDQVVARLAEWVDGWSEGNYGLDGPETDQVLASVAVLSLLARDAERAEELHALLQDIESLLAPPRGSDPDLCLAFAQGWLELLKTPFAASIPADEQVRGLDCAIQHAESVDPADQRDTLGSRLAHELYRLLRAAGRERESADVLEGALSRFPAAPEKRPYLLAALADVRRAEGDWSQAWARLLEAEEGYASLASYGVERHLLERTIAGSRCQLELAWGLPDQAVVSYEREREAFEAGASDPESHLDLLLNASGIALGTANPIILNRSLDRFDKALAEESLFAQWPRARAQILARRALMQALLEEAEPTPEPRAPALLRAAFGEEALDEAHRAAVGMQLFEIALRGHDLDAAGAWLARLEGPSDGAQRAPELTTSLVAARGKLALARGAGRDELERHAAELQGRYETFLQSFRERPERAGGLGYLDWRNRRLLVGTLLELALALGTEEAAVDRLLPEQAIGSLALQMHCQPGSVAAVRKELLGPGTGLLLYLPGWKSVHLFCIDGKDIVHDEIRWGYVLEQDPRELGDLLSKSPSDSSEGERDAQLRRIEEITRKLSERLLPIRARERLRRWKGVYLAGDERLGTIPFECLPLDGVRLGERIALAHLPSVPVGLELANRARGPAGPGLELLLVAAPELAKSTAERNQLASFSLDKKQLSLLTSPFERELVLTGKEANWTRVEHELESGAPRALHFLVHGVSDPLRELCGGLALAPRADDPAGILWCEQLFRESFVSPPLVILSACGSARAPRRAGDDGLAQLGGAFFLHGALCTVQATSDIALGPTVELMGSFTSKLAEGMAPAEAMRSARVELARRPGLGHPFYACSMRVVGWGLEPLSR